MENNSGWKHGIGKGTEVRRVHSEKELRLKSLKKGKHKNMSNSGQKHSQGENMTKFKTNH